MVRSSSRRSVERVCLTVRRVIGCHNGFLIRKALRSSGTFGRSRLLGLLKEVAHCRVSRNRRGDSVRRSSRGGLITPTGNRLTSTLYTAHNSHSVQISGTLRTLDTMGSLSHRRETVIGTVFTKLRNGGLSLTGVFIDGRFSSRGGGVLNVCFGGSSCRRGYIRVMSSKLLSSRRHRFLSHVRKRCGTVTLGRLLKESADISSSGYTDCSTRHTG